VSLLRKQKQKRKTGISYIRIKQANERKMQKKTTTDKEILCVYVSGGRTAAACVVIQQKNKSTADYCSTQSNRRGGGGHFQTFLPCKIAVNFRNVHQLSITAAAESCAQSAARFGTLQQQSTQICCHL
jgi:hypothetical protein